MKTLFNFLAGSFLMQHEDFSVKILSFAVGIFVLTTCSLPLIAQQPDGVDPFGGASDPFGAAATTAGSASDPFGASTEPSRSAVDPFATEDPRQLKPGLDDPFSSSPIVRKTNPHVVRDAEAAEPRAQARLQRTKLSSEEQIRFELNQPASVTAIDETLENFVRNLAETHDIRMVIDKRALEEIGLSSDTPISSSLQGINLRNLLLLSLRELDLTYCIKNEVLIITTIEAAERRPTLKTYTLPETLAKKGDNVLAALKTNVRPDTWDLSGGPSTATRIDNVFVVSGTETLHDEVQDFMQKVTEAFERTQSEKH